MEPEWRVNMDIRQRFVHSKIRVVGRIVKQHFAHGEQILSSSSSTPFSRVSSAAASKSPQRDPFSLFVAEESTIYPVSHVSHFTPMLSSLHRSEPTSRSASSSSPKRLVSRELSACNAS